MSKAMSNTSERTGLIKELLLLRFHAGGSIGDILKRAVDMLKADSLEEPISAATHKLNSNRTAAVSVNTYWLPIDEDVPLGVKLWLINKHAGSAYPAQYRPGDPFPTHWHPNPKFKD